MTIRPAKCFWALPIIVLRLPLSTSVISARPRKPCAVHFHPENDNHWMPKIARRFGPFVDVRIPFARKDLSQTELVRSMIFLVRLVPWRPENKRQRAVAPDHVEIVDGKILFSPITR